MGGTFSHYLIWVQGTSHYSNYILNKGFQNDLNIEGPYIMCRTNTTHRYSRCGCIHGPLQTNHYGLILQGMLFYSNIPVNKDPPYMKIIPIFNSSSEISCMSPWGFSNRWLIDFNEPLFNDKSYMMNLSFYNVMCWQVLSLKVDLIFRICLSFIYYPHLLA